MPRGQKGWRELKRKFDGKNYDWVGDGGLVNVNMRAEDLQEQGFKIRRVERPGGMYSLYKRKEKRRRR